MIQRIQSVWFVLAAIAGGLAFQFPFYAGQRLYDGQPAYAEMTATYNVPIIIFVAAAVVGAVHGLFSYYKRKHQFLISVLSLISSIVAIVLMFLGTADFESGQITLGSICIFAVPVFLFLAAKGVRNDEKLVRSMDRLR